MRDTRHGSDPRLAAALAQLCQREGLNPHKTAAVLRIALSWMPGLPRDPSPLLRQSMLPARRPSYLARSHSGRTRVPRSLSWLLARLLSQRQAAGPRKKPMAERAEMIRQRAYEIWRAEGQPDGRALEHWCRAEAEIARRQPAGTRPRDPSGRTQAAHSVKLRPEPDRGGHLETSPAQPASRLSR